MEIDRSQLTPKPSARFGIRHLQYMLMSLAIAVGYGMRTILNVAVISMIGKDDNSNSTDRDYPVYPEWESKKNLMLSSFFWGYVCLQIGAGQLAKKYGAKLFLMCAMLITSCFTLLIPIFGQWFGYIGVIVCRVVQGATQGFLFPSVHTLLSLWAPLSERARWGTIVYAGLPIGNVISMPVTGLLAATSAGWPVVFYLYGVLGFIWCAAFFYYGSPSPAKDKRISEDERKWIESEIDETEEKEKVPTPWKAIFTSPPFLALLLTHIGQNWGFWTLLTEIPSYMQQILDFDIAQNSLLSALPYFVTFILSLIISPIAQMIIDKKYVKLGTSRKIFNSIGQFVPAVALIILCIVGASSKVVVIVLLVIAVGTNAGTYCGFNINHIDLSPVHTGPLMGITNSIAALAAILAPLAVDLIADVSGYSEKEEALWQIVFYISAGVYIAVGLIFDIFGSGEVQPWNYPQGVDPEKLKSDVRKKVSIIYQSE